MAPEDPPARANPARGLALIATALILGIFVLRQGFDTTDDLAAAGSVGTSDEEVAGDGGSDDSGNEEGEGDDEESDEPEPEPEPRDPADLTVRVANTTAVAGVAGSMTEDLPTNGYQTADPTDTNAERDLPTSVIVHAEGLEREALVLAGAIGDAEQIQLRPASPEGFQPGDESLIEGADLVILVGQDLANQPES